jgi:SAM-dependent methyltransferase
LYTKTIEECGFPAAEFDFVILSAVLEHLYDPRSVIAEISHVLRPGGLIFVDVPNEKGLIFKAGNFYQKIRGRRWCVNLAPTFPPFHLFGFSPQSLPKLLALEGLELKKMYVFSGRSVLPDRAGVMGLAEGIAARLFTAASKIGNLGGYIAAWAEKK